MYCTEARKTLGVVFCESKGGALTTLFRIIDIIPKLFNRAGNDACSAVGGIGTKTCDSGAPAKDSCVHTEPNAPPSLKAAGKSSSYIPPHLRMKADWSKRCLGRKCYLIPKGPSGAWFRLRLFRVRFVSTVSAPAAPALSGTMD